jgi:HEAT repeat protein
MLERQIVPSLQQALRTGGDIPFMRQALLAWARAGGSEGGELEQYARHYLKEDNPELQEAAILALGIQGRADSFSALSHILLDDAEGRELMGGMPAGARNRAFAAYSLGMIARQNDSAELDQLVVHTLLEVLGDERTTTRENQVACALAVGLVPLEFCGDDPAKLERHRMEGDKHLCGGVQLRYLLDIYRDAELDPWLRAHVAPSMGRLGRNAPEEFRSAVAVEFENALDLRADVEPEVRHSVAIGTGLFADSDSDASDESLRKALMKCAKSGDMLTRRFALISLAKVAGRPGTGADAGKGTEKVEQYILRSLTRGKDGMRGWAALAAGVLGHSQMEAAQLPSEDLGRALRLSLGRTKDAQDAAACLLALGVLRDEASTEAVLKHFEKADDPALKSYASVTLGLLSAREARESVGAALLEAEQVEEDEAPVFAADYALALRLLGDGDVVPRLLKRMNASEDDAERAAIAGVLGILSDSRAVAPLVALVENREVDDSVRASAAAALGGLADSDVVVWNADYAADVNYDILTWTLKSPFGDGSGLLDLR